MLLTCAVPFQSERNRDSGIWFLPLKHDISIETVRFLNETILYNEKLRPFPDQLLECPYMSSDVSDAKPVRSQLVIIIEERAMCLDLDIVQQIGPIKEKLKDQRQLIENPERLFFNTRQPRFFEELYSLCTGNFSFTIKENPQKSPVTISIVIEDTESRSCKSETRNARFRIDDKSMKQNELNMLQMPIFDVLIFGEKDTGKKCFM